LFWLPVSAQETEQKQTVSKEDRMYLDPERKFAILVPRQAEAMVPEGDIDLLIRSRVGWIINVQSSPTNPSLSVAQMAARFESRYLGMDQPWTQKLS